MTSTPDTEGAAYNATVGSEEGNAEKREAAREYYLREVEKAEKALEQLRGKLEKAEERVEDVKAAIAEKETERDALREEGGA